MYGASILDIMERDKRHGDAYARTLPHLTVTENENIFMMSHNKIAANISVIYNLNNSDQYAIIYDGFKYASVLKSDDPDYVRVQVRHTNQEDLRPHMRRVFVDELLRSEMDSESYLEEQEYFELDDLAMALKHNIISVARYEVFMFINIWFRVAD